MIPDDNFTPVDMYSAIEEFCGFRIYSTTDTKTNKTIIKIVNASGGTMIVPPINLILSVEKLLKFVEDTQMKQLEELEQNKN